MRLPVTRLAAALLLLTHPVGAQPSRFTPSSNTRVACVVASVYDGDTMHVTCPEGRTKVRLLGIDAPEMQQAEGATARDRLRALAPVGQKITLETEVDVLDRYGRTLGYIWAGDALLNATLLREGLVWSYQSRRHVRHLATFSAAEASAKSAHRGLFDGGTRCQAGDFRHGRCGGPPRP
jgi:micrococcal nuclease